MNTMKNDFQKKIKQLICMLLVNGYSLTRYHSITSNTCVLLIKKHDILGAPVQYGIILSTASPAAAERAMALSYIRTQKHHILNIGINTPTDGNSLSYSNFEKLLGGPVSESILLQPDLSGILDSLGHNKMPAGLKGTPDDILENAVRDCLQYLFADKAYCYGQQRRFEKVPDGIAFGKKDLIVLYDAKAYKDGFKIGADDIRRFSSYIKEFNTTYAAYSMQVYCFLVVSGHFPMSASSLTNYADELYTQCQTKLCFIPSTLLGKIVIEIRKHHRERFAINWKKLLSKTVFDIAKVKVELKRIKADKII